MNFSIINNRTMDTKDIKLQLFDLNTLGSDLF